MLPSQVPRLGEPDLEVFPGGRTPVRTFPRWFFSPVTFRMLSSQSKNTNILGPIYYNDTLMWFVLVLTDLSQLCYSFSPMAHQFCIHICRPLFSLSISYIQNLVCPVVGYKIPGLRQTDWPAPAERWNTATNISRPARYKPPRSPNQVFTAPKIPHFSAWNSAPQVHVCRHP